VLKIIFFFYYITVKTRIFGVKLIISTVVKGGPLITSHNMVLRCFFFEIKFSMNWNYLCLKKVYRIENKKEETIVFGTYQNDIIQHLFQSNYS